jgi:hypothetical protein
MTCGAATEYLVSGGDRSYSISAMGVVQGNKTCAFLYALDEHDGKVFEEDAFHWGGTKSFHLHNGCKIRLSTSEVSGCSARGDTGVGPTGYGCSGPATVAEFHGAPPPPGPGHHGPFSASFAVQ